MRLVPILLAIAACAPAPGPGFSEGAVQPPNGYARGWYEDWFTPTWQICGQPDEFDPWEPMYPWADDDYTGMEFTLSDACVDALLADLKLDRALLAEQLGDNAWVTERRISKYVYLLLSMPLGSVEELLERAESGEPHLGTPVARDLAALAWFTGETQVRPLVYNMVMSSILRTENSRDLGTLLGAAALDSREVRISEELVYHGDAPGAVVIVHEAAHIWLQQGHVECLPGSLRPGEFSCDDTWLGALGYHGTVTGLMTSWLPYTDSPDLAELLAHQLQYWESSAEGQIHTECCAEALEAR